MLRKLFIVMMLVAFALTSFAGTIAENKAALIKAAKEKAPTIDAVTLKSWMETKKDFLLLDVRTDKEVAAIKINADNYAHYERGIVEFYFTGKYSNPDQVIVVYCKADSRGALVVNRLIELGYKNVYNLKDGIKGWMKAGYAVENGQGMFKLVEE